jgi:hypothetical protein
VEPLGKGRDRSVRTPELLQNAASGGVRERAERGVEVVLEILNHVVQYTTWRNGMQWGAEVRDSKRFSDSGNWGWAVFEYDTASHSFRPGTLEGTPPQGNDAKCGFACHTIVKSRDFVFTDYAGR